jgi:hypothetical protein
VCEAKLAIKFNKQFISRLEFIAQVFRFVRILFLSRLPHLFEFYAAKYTMEFCNNGLNLMDFPDGVNLRDWRHPKLI